MKKIGLLILIGLSLFTNLFAQDNKLQVKDFTCIVYGIISDEYYDMLTEIRDNKQNKDLINKSRINNILYTAYEQKGKTDELDKIKDYVKPSKKNLPKATGFIYVDKNGKNYIVTSLKNTWYCDKAYIEKIDFSKNETKVYKNLKKIAENANLNVSVFAFENDERPFTKGMPLALNQDLMDGEDLLNGKYDFSNDEYIWKVRKTIVSTSNYVDADKIVKILSSDSFENDTFSFIKDESSQVKYSLVGVYNDFSNDYGSSYITPAKEIKAFLDELNSKNGEKEKLQKNAEIFVNSLNKEYNYTNAILKYVSNSSLSTMNMSYYRFINKKSSTGYDYYSNRAFDNNPLEGYKNAYYKRWWYLYNTVPDKKSTKNSFSVKDVKITDTNKAVVEFQDENKENILTSNWVCEYSDWHIESICYTSDSKNASVDKNELNNKNGKSSKSGISSNFQEKGLIKFGLFVPVLENCTEKDSKDLIDSGKVWGATYSIEALVSKYFAFGISLNFVPTDLDTFRLISLDTAISFPFIFEETMIRTFGGAKIEWNLFTNAAAWAYSFDAGLEVIFNTFGFGANYEWLNIIPISKVSHKYDIQKVNFYFIWPDLFY